MHAKTQHTLDLVKMILDSGLQGGRPSDVVGENEGRLHHPTVHRAIHL